MAIKAIPGAGPEERPEWLSKSTGANGDAFLVAGYGSFTFQVVVNSGSTWTVKFQGSNDGGTSYHDLPMRNRKTAALTASGSTIAAAGIYEIDCSGLGLIRPVYTMTSSNISIFGAFGPSRGVDIGVPVTLTSGAVTGPLTDAELRATPVPVSGTVTASGPVTNAELRAAPVTTRSNSSIFFTSGTLSETTEKQVLAATGNAKLMALWVKSLGTGTLDLTVYHGTSSAGTEIASYSSTTVPAGPVSLFPDMPRGGFPVASGIFVWAQTNDNSDFHVYGVYQAVADI